MKISEILAKYDTDKVRDHSYGDAYNELFNRFNREDKLSILEIGVQKGWSLKAWQDYFPNAEIIGVDIKDEREIKVGEFILSDVKNYKTDRTFDIIIDDGSHFPNDVEFVIKNFKDKLKPNGVMIIEDIQDESLWSGYNLMRCGNNYDDLLLII